MKFVERQYELGLLSSIVEKNSSAFVVIYGRRRIGKTETVRYFCESNSINYIEFAGKFDQPRNQQIQGIARKLSRYSPELEIKAVSTWQDIFYLFEDYIDSQPKNKKTIIFLDEIPWMDTPKSGFLGELAAFWNEYCSRRNNVILIVCGSAASYMLKKVLQDRGPLHGRATNKIGMEQFNLHSTRELLVASGWALSNRSIADIYMATGGVAKYLVSLDSSKTPTQAIQDLCFEKNALLKNEYQSLLHSLFKEATTHYAIMNLLATRWEGLTQEEISHGTGISKGTISTTLTELVASGFLSIRSLFNARKKMAVYSGADMFCYFHHKWINDRTVQNWNKTAFTQSAKSWSGFAFEKICHLHIDQIKHALGIGGIQTNAYYWSYKPTSELEKGVQIDLLLKHENGSRDVELIECKYYDDEYVISKTYKEELLRKRAIFNKLTENKYNVRLVLCASNGVAKNDHFNELNPKIITLDDLFHS